jgi:hypothetical protein
MGDVSRRLLTLEIQHVRGLVAKAAAETGVSAEALLAAAIAFLQRPREEQRSQCPGFTDDELDRLEGCLPLYRQAWRGPGKGRR